MRPLGSFSYDPYGTLSGSTGTSTTPLGYAGQYTDAETGLQYDRARYYDPKTGQFATRDPLTPLTRQPYAYAFDTPVNARDPLGLCGFGSFGDFGDCFNPVSKGNLAYQGANAVVQHPLQTAEIAAAGACIVASDALCLGAIGGAGALNTIHNAAAACSFSQFFRAEGITAAETILGGGGGLIKAGLGAAGAFDYAAGNVLPRTLAGNAALNAPLSVTSASVTVLEPTIDEQVPGAHCSC